MKKNVEITPSESKRFFDFINMIMKNTTNEQHKDMFAPVSFNVKYDDERLQLCSIEWTDVKGCGNILYFPKHPEQIIHWIAGRIRLSRYANRPLFDDVCQLLTDDFGGYLDTPMFKSKDIDEIIVGTDGDHLTTFTVIDKNDNHHDLRNVFFENEIVSLMVIVYNIMGIADKICKAV